MIIRRNKNLLLFSRELRTNATRAEKRLWYDFLSTHSCKFRRQAILGNYIADFYCFSKKLIIEVDGSGHFEDNQMTADQLRTDYFEGLGYTVIRFTNHEMMYYFSGVCERIDEIIASST